MALFPIEGVDQYRENSLLGAPVESAKSRCQDHVPQGVSDRLSVYCDIRILLLVKMLRKCCQVSVDMCCESNLSIGYFTTPVSW